MMEYYSAIRRSKVLIHVLTWIKKPATKGHVWYDRIYMKYPE